MNLSTKEKLNIEQSTYLEYEVLSLGVEYLKEFIKNKESGLEYWEAVKKTAADHYRNQWKGSTRRKRDEAVAAHIESLRWNPAVRVKVHIDTPMIWHRQLWLKVKHRIGMVPGIIYATWCFIKFIFTGKSDSDILWEGPYWDWFNMEYWTKRIYGEKQKIEK